MGLKRIVEAKFIMVHTIVDPDTGGDVQVEIYKDTQSGGMFGIDASYVDQVLADDEGNANMISPFNSEISLQLGDE